MIPFPSIKQFRDVVRAVQHRARFIGVDDGGAPIYDNSRKPPTLRFRGSVKLHGTNAAVVFSPDGVSFQSRERMLTAEADNAGFYAHMIQHMDELRRIASKIERVLGLAVACDNTIAVYGEWCGGNIQNNVAINGLPKMFVVFALKVNGEWQDAGHVLRSRFARIFNVADFQQFDTSIDFDAPELSQNHLGAITQAVEAQCPVGHTFGNFGIGEGVVWRCLDNPTSEYWFKVKGEKHSASKVKTLAAVDVEAFQALADFVAAAVTPARLEQGLQNLVNEQQKPFAMSSMGGFIRWVYGDVIKEEADTIAAAGFDPKKLGGPIATAARRWYSAKLEEVK